MRYLKLLLVLLICASFPALVYSQDPVIILEHKELGKHQRPAVEFNHEKHAEKIDCLKCHHDYDAHMNNRGGEGQACSTCHWPEGVQGVPPLQDAFHLQCKGCHENQRARGKASGPVTCGGCHVLK